MKIAAVCTAYHEADILPWSVEHLLAEGVDHVYIEVPLGDRETIAAMRGIHDVTITPMVELYHDQPASINRMARKSARATAAFDFNNEDVWILPFDADEFWFACRPDQNIRQALKAVPPEVGVLKVGMLQQRDWHYREGVFKPLPKVAYRWCPEADIGLGNHSVAGVPGEDRYNVLSLREIQYRSFEHFCRKVEERTRTLDPNADPTQGFHITQHSGKSEEELRKAWEALCEPAVTWDPIPSRIRPPVHLAPPLELLPIEKLFDQFLTEPNDMCGHMERLRDLAKDKRVLELGVNCGVSTVAFMAGHPKDLLSVDITPPRVRPEVDADREWDCLISDDLDPELIGEFVPGEWDVIFIDTSHTMRHTVEELKTYEPFLAPGGCFIMHDTESIPEVSLAIQHFLHVLRDRGREPTRIEKYSHSEGLQIIWLP